LIAQGGFEEGRIQHHTSKYEFSTGHLKLTIFSVLVIGARNSGKTSFLDFLRTSLAAKKRLNRPADETEPTATAKANRNFVHHYLETEIDGERVGLTLWDSQGLEKNVVDLQLREVSSFIQSKFEDTFSEEMKVVRAPGVRDTHIHCVFLILDPVRLDANMQAAKQQSAMDKAARKLNTPSKIVGALDEDFDLQVLRTLQGKTTVVPVISKADTITTAHMAFLKKMVHDTLKKTGLDPLEALSFDADDDSEEDDNGIIDKFDEREEDAENARNNTESPDSEDGRTSPHTSDSETLPQDQPTPTVVRRASLRQKPAGSDAVADDIPADLPYLPYSILSPDPYSLSSGEGPVGRKFPWGFADPYNPEHCDFTKLKESCFGEWRAELREASKEIWYERWRTSRLNRQGMAANGVDAKKNNGISKGAKR
jgi:septin family protein